MLKSCYIQVMVLNIIKLLDNTYQVQYAIKTDYNNIDYKGLIVVEYKTNNLDVFRKFSAYGKWKRAKLGRVGDIIRIC